MVNTRKFIVSGSIFDKYETNINLDIIDSIEEVIRIVKKRIENDISNYPEILKELNKINFHIHDVQFVDVLLSESKDVFYICSFCSENGNKNKNKSYYL